MSNRVGSEKMPLRYNPILFQCSENGPLREIAESWVAKTHEIDVFFYKKRYGFCQNYTLEWFLEAGSAPIRSAVKFYFDLDVRIFPTF